MDIVSFAKQRFTAKVYDPSRKISEKDFDQLTTLLRYSPSSVNSQPWHFIVVKTDEGKKLINDAIADFNQPRTLNASHVIVFCARRTLDEQHLQRVHAEEMKDGRFANEEEAAANDAGRRYFSALNNQTPEDFLKWESKQIYIALGTLLLGAETMGINATPIEGFDPAKMDEILGLKEKGLTSIVVASLGYSAEDDFNAKKVKSRLPKEEIFTFI